MQLARFSTKVLLTFIVLCEAGAAWQLWRHGPPMQMVVTSDKLKEAGELSFKWVRVPMSVSDWMIFAAVIASQVALIGFLWWSGRKISRA